MRLPLCLPLLAAAFLSLGTGARADEAPVGAWSAAGDLEVRILPGEGHDDGRLVAPVGRPFAVRYELRNRGNEPLLVPLGHPSFVVGTVRYVDPGSGIAIGGRGWGPAPFRDTLVELAPGTTRVETLRLTPSSHGPARVHVSFVCGYDEVSESVWVSTPRAGGGEARHAERRAVPEPRLWQGTLEVEAPLDVVFSSHYGEEDGIDPRRIAMLWRGDLPLLERLDLLGRVATLDPSSRAVDLLRQGFGLRRGGPAWPVPVRIECAKQLAIAAGKGYGWHGLKTLLAAAKDEGEDETVRLLALEGLAPVLRDRLRATEGDCTFDLQVPAVWKTEALLLLSALAEEPSPLGRRARAILDARAEALR